MPSRIGKNAFAVKPLVTFFTGFMTYYPVLYGVTLFTGRLFSYDSAMIGFRCTAFSGSAGVVVAEYSGMKYEEQILFVRRQTIRRSSPS